MAAVGGSLSIARENLVLKSGQTYVSALTVTRNLDSPKPRAHTQVHTYCPSGFFIYVGMPT